MREAKGNGTMPAPVALPKERHTNAVALPKERHTNAVALPKERHTNPVALPKERHTNAVALPKERHTNLDRRGFLKRAAAVTSAWTLATDRNAPAQQPRKPNILLINTDQQHWRAYGASDPFFDTPHIDALAKSGTVFHSAYCTTPQCSPSRSSLHTGLYPHKTRVLGNLGSIDHTGKPIADLPESFETIASRLEGAGYDTAYFGKWHLGNHGHFSKHFRTADLDGEAHDGATKQALAFLGERTAKPDVPFALFVSYINPHDIYQFNAIGKRKDVGAPSIAVPHPASWCETFEGKPAPQKSFMTDDQGKAIWGKPDAYWERYRELYREKCRLADAQVGRVLGKLNEFGLDENTAVVFVSDHGDMDTNHRLIYKGPFMYEHLVRVPLIMRVPKACGGAPGATEEFAVLTDVLPTLCALTGTEAGLHDGASLAPFLTGRGAMPHRDYVVSEYYNKQKWVNPIRMIRTRTFKYNRYIQHGEELYDLKNDPDELVNLAQDAGYQARKKELAGELQRWMAENGDTAFDAYWPTNRDGTRFAARNA